MKIFKNKILFFGVRLLFIFTIVLFDNHDNHKSIKHDYYIHLKQKKNSQKKKGIKNKHCIKRTERQNKREKKVADKNKYIETK